MKKKLWVILSLLIITVGSVTTYFAINPNIFSNGSSSNTPNNSGSTNPTNVSNPPSAPNPATNSPNPPGSNNPTNVSNQPAAPNPTSNNNLSPLEISINKLYQDTQAQMPTSSDINFTALGDPSWDNNIDLANDLRVTFPAMWNRYSYPDNFKWLYDFDEYIKVIKTMAPKYIELNDEKQFFTLDEAMDYINNATNSDYLNIINWIDKDQKIIQAISNLNNQLDQDISTTAADDITIANLSAQKNMGKLELKITLSSPVFTNPNLNLNTTSSIDFSYFIDKDKFLHPSFKDLLNDAVKAQKALNNANLKLKLDDVDPTSFTVSKSLEHYWEDLETRVDALLDDNKDKRNIIGHFPLWTKTETLENVLNRINNLPDFSIDVSSLTNDIKNFQVIGTQIKWDYWLIDKNNKSNHHMEIYIQNSTSPVQYYSLEIPLIIDSKMYIHNRQKNDNSVNFPKFMIEDKSMWKIFKKAYFDLQTLTVDEQTKLDAFVTESRFIQRLQEDLKNPTNTYDPLEAIEISIWDEDVNESKFLVVTLNSPHTYSANRDISWQNDFESFLLNGSLTRKIDDKFIWIF